MYLRRYNKLCQKVHNKMYSKNLKQKVIEACLEGKESFRKIEERFKVSFRLVSIWWRQYKEKESLDPHIHLRGSGFKIDHGKLQHIVEQFGKNSHLTNKKLSELYEQEVGIKISESTISRALKRIRKGAFK